MAESVFNELVVLFSAGLALMVLGGLSWYANRHALAIGFIGALAVAALVPFVLDVPNLSLIAIAILVSVVGVAAVVGTKKCRDAVCRLSTIASQPWMRGSVLASVGIALMAAGMVRYDAIEQEAIERDNAFLDETVAQPPLQPADSDVAYSDSGRKLNIQEPAESRSIEMLESAERKLLTEMGYSEHVIRLTPVNDACNCHGWIYTGGRYWVSGADVELILTDNGYQAVNDPKPGDLAIYRDHGLISHTAIVRAVGPRVLVEGKWGWMGVFIHEVASSCWGKNYTYYRSPREGHLLVGLGGSNRHGSPDSDAIGTDEP